MTSDHLSRGAGRNGFSSLAETTDIIIHGKLTKDKPKLVMSEYNDRLIDI